MSVLAVQDLHAGYGLGLVLHGLSLTVGEGEAVCLLGRNGAGKTTTLKAIVGLVRPVRGSITFCGQPLAGLRPFQICRSGIGYVPEDRRIFPDLTVLENLEVGRRPGPAGDQGWTVERVLALFPALRRLSHRRGQFLSGGEQRMLAIARALMGNPRLLLLDEPSEGLAPLVVEALWEQIDQLRRQGLSILLSEQNLWFAAELCHRVYIIDRGQIRFTGTFRDLEQNPDIQRSYLAV